MKLNLMLAMLCVLLTPTLVLDQIGNVAILLEQGEETDDYDFLELYIRRWKKEQRLVREACGVTGLLEEQEFYKADDEEQEENGFLRRALGVEQETVQAKRRAEHDESPQILSKPWFNRTFNPYDWYVKTETEVGQSSVLLVFVFTETASSHPSLDAVLLSLHRIHARTSLLRRCALESVKRPRKSCP